MTHGPNPEIEPAGLPLLPGDARSTTSVGRVPEGKSPVSGWDLSAFPVKRRSRGSWITRFLDQEVLDQEVLDQEVLRGAGSYLCVALTRQGITAQSVRPGPEPVPRVMPRDDRGRAIHPSGDSGDLRGLVDRPILRLSGDRTLGTFELCRSRSRPGPGILSRIDSNPSSSPRRAAWCRSLASLGGSLRHQSSQAPDSGCGGGSAMPFGLGGVKVAIL